MARRGRKPKSVKAKEFLINNDKDFNSRGGKKGMIFSSAAKFMNTMPNGESHAYMTPVKKGERLGKGKYRIVAHYPNKQSDDRDSYESTRKSKDLVFEDNLTKPSRIKYDGLVGTGGYHLITHDRDGKRVEFILGNWAGFKNTHGDVGFPVYAEMYLPDMERKRTTGKKLMACPVKVGTFIVSNSHPGEMKLQATKPKGECAKFGNSNAKKHQVSPLEYEKAAETEEHFMSEGELLHFYSMNGVTMDAEGLLSDYQAIDSVIVDRSSYQPAQDYGAESFAADEEDEFDCIVCEKELPESNFTKDEDAEMCNSCFKTHGICGVCQDTELLTDLHLDSTGMMRLCARCEKYDAYAESFNADTLDEFCASCGEHQAEGCGGCHAAEEDAATYVPSSNPDMVNSIQTEPTNSNFSAEGDAANYSPSSEPDMINSIATEPTNAEADLFGAESKNKWVKGKNGKTYVLRKKTGHMVTHNADDMVICGGCEQARHSDSEFSIDNARSDVLDDGNVLCNYCWEKHYEDSGDAEWDCSKCDGLGYDSTADEPLDDDGESMGPEHCPKCGGTGIQKDYDKRYHGAESPGGAYPTLEDFNGLESVVVEPPLGHGVAQWYAEGDAATYSPSNEPDMVNEIQTEPTNANPENFEGENLDEVRTGFNYGIGGYLGFTSIALGSLLLMELIGRKMGE